MSKKKEEEKRALVEIWARHQVIRLLGEGRAKELQGEIDGFVSGLPVEVLCWERFSEIKSRFREHFMPILAADTEKDPTQDTGS